MTKRRPLPVWVRVGPGHSLRESSSAGIAKANGAVLGSVWEAQGKVWAQAGSNQAWQVPTVQAGKLAVEAAVKA